MRISVVMDELADALATIPDLRVSPYWATRIVPPAAVVGWPDPLTYDETYRRGMDRLTLPVIVLVGKVDARSARDQAAAYADPAGPSSVKHVLEALEPVGFDTVRVQRAEFSGITVAAVEYLAVTFTLDITGSGS